MGLTINEPGTYAVKAATEMAVVELIKEGARKGIWEYKPDMPVVLPAPVVEKKAPVISSEIKKDVEEKKDVVVQPQTQSETKTETLPPAPAEVKIEEKVQVKPNENKMSQESARALFGKRILKQDSYLYTEQDEKSTKKWLFKKGTVVDVRQPGSDGWFRVTDSELKGGWIRSDQLEDVK